MNGPSPAAIERLDRVLLVLWDAGEPLTTRQVLDRLSEPMSRNDGDAALRRLLGAEMIAPVVGSHPARWSVTNRGHNHGIKLVQRGDGY